MNFVACRSVSIAFLLLGALCTRADETIACSFDSGQPLPKALKLDDDWIIADQVLRNRQAESFKHSFHLHPESNWQDFELSFKLRINH